MSTQLPTMAELDGTPRLTPLGKRIERLRIERGLSKQRLAQRSGTSRQQLWRVMSGKAELTGGHCLRLAEALGIDPRLLSCPELPLPEESIAATAAPTRAAMAAPTRATSAREYLERSELIARTLRTLPDGPGGIALKRGFLNALEDAARDHRLELPAGFFELRRRVLNEEL